MMRSWILGLAAACLLSGTAMAQDAGMDRRLVLADRYLELSVGASLRQNLEEQFKTAYEKSDMTAEQRTWLSTHMAAAFDQALHEASAAMRTGMADLYTEDELAALIAFQSTPVGQSINDKGVRMGMMTQEALQEPLTEALTVMMTKYCAAFTCAAAGADGGAAKNSVR